MGKLIIENNYGTTPNEILNHPEISLKAKGMFGFLQSKPPEWKFSTERIALQLKEGEKSVRSALQELEEFGLLKRKLMPKGSDGKWTGYDYILSIKINRSPKPSLPKTVGRLTGNTVNGEDISKKDYSKQDIVRKKDIYIADKSANVNNLQDLYSKMGIPKPTKSVYRWQEEAYNATQFFTDGEDKRSSIFKCFKDNPQKARTALSDCKELEKPNVLYFLKVYNELKK